MKAVQYPAETLQTTVLYLPADGIQDTRTSSSRPRRDGSGCDERQRDGFRRLGPYRLGEKIGEGGMGEVYVAKHPLLDRPCAIKVITPSRKADHRMKAHFEREIQVTAGLTHWNTVEVFDCGHAEDGSFYYVMEYLPGLNLADMVSQYGPLPPERTIHFLSQVCSALREAHSIGLIHCDIKPANIYATTRGGVHDVAKVLDFGLAKVKKLCGERTDCEKDSEPAFSGSPMYMSPEQATFGSDVDRRSDIYSLGAVAYHLLTGKPPFQGDCFNEILAARQGGRITLPSELNPRIPKDLERVVMRCLARYPKQRFQCVHTLGQQLAGCQCAGRWTEEKAAAWWRCRRHVD